MSITGKSSSIHREIIRKVLSERSGITSRDSNLITETDFIKIKSSIADNTFSLFREGYLSSVVIISLSGSSSQRRIGITV
jgi:hypothetical protein